MSNIIKGLEFGELSEKSELAQEPSNDSAVIDVVGYGKMSVDTLKHYIKDYSNKLNALVQNEEFLKALEQAMSSNYKKQFIYPLGALAHATKSGLHEEDIEEGYRAGVVGGAGLGIEKSPMEKVLEKPLGDLDEHIGSPGGMGQSYRKFKPKASGMMEEYSDLEDRRKAIQDLQMDPDTSKDPMLRKEVIRLKNELNKAEQLEKLKKMNKGNGRPQPRIATEGLDKAKIHAEYKEIKKELTQMGPGRTDTPIKLKRRQELQTRLKELMSILQSKEGVSEGKNKGKEDYDRIKELKSKTNAQLQSLLDFWKKSLEEEPVTPMDHHVVKRAKEQIPLIKSIMAERIGKKGVEEGWKGKVAGGVLAASALAASVHSPMAHIKGQKIQMAISGSIPSDARLVTDDDGKKIYVWKSTSPKGHGQLMYRPAEQVKEQGVAEGSILKSIKRGWDGWRKDGVTPQSIKKRAGEWSDDELKDQAATYDRVRRVRANSLMPTELPKHSPEGLQKRIIGRELKKRGIGEQTVEEGFADMFKQTKNPADGAKVSNGIVYIGDKVNVEGYPGVEGVVAYTHHHHGRIAVMLYPEGYKPKAIAVDPQRVNIVGKGVAEGGMGDFGGGGYPKTPNYKVGDMVMVKGYQGVGKIAYIKHRGDVGVMFKEPSHPRVVTTIDDLIPKQGVAEGSEDDLSNYTKLLQNHDWNYSYSWDDSEAQRGYDEEQTLLKLAKKLDPKFKIWNKVAPAGSKKKSEEYNPCDDYPDYGLDEQGVEEGFTHDPRGTTGIPHTDKFGIRSRGVNLPVADTKDFKRYSNYEKWSRDIERVNSLLLDDRADFKSDQNGVHVTMNGKRIAAWSHRNKNGDIDIRAAKEYNQGITEGALKDIEGQLKKHEQKRIDREKAGDPYVAHEIVSHDLIHKQLLDKRNQIMRKNQKRAVDENSMVKEVTIKDRKTGKEYDPKAEFEKLQNDPEYIDQMKRMSKKDASNLHVNDRVVISGNVNFQGEKGNIESFGRQKAFVIVHLDNYGSHSFHSSDVSYLDDQDEYQEESSIMKGLRR